jgi:drug/metabolite transporter (DMT)-like permease
VRAAVPALAYLAAYGAVLAVFNILWTFSVARCGAAIATVLVYTSCASSALLGFFWLGERISWAKLWAIALCLGGCVLVSGAWNASWSGALAGAAAGMASGVCYAVYGVMGRVVSQRGIDAWTTVLCAFGFAALWQLLAMTALRLFGPPVLAASSQILWLGGQTGGWLHLALLAAGPTLIGFGLYNESLAVLHASEVNLIVTLEPAMTTLLAYFTLGERLRPVEIAGSVVILAGVVVLRLGEARPVTSESG